MAADRSTPEAGQAAFLIRTSGRVFKDAWNREYMMAYPEPLGDRDDNLDLKALVLPFDGEPPPTWAIGTKVRVDRDNYTTVKSTPFWYAKAWHFMDVMGRAQPCSAFEPVPPEKTWRVKITERDVGRTAITVTAPDRASALAKLDEMLEEVDDA